MNNTTWPCLFWIWAACLQSWACSHTCGLLLSPNCWELQDDSSSVLKSCHQPANIRPSAAVTKHPQRGELNCGSSLRVWKSRKQDQARKKKCNCNTFFTTEDYTEDHSAKVGGVAFSLGSLQSLEAQPDLNSTICNWLTMHSKLNIRY